MMKSSRFKDYVFLLCIGVEIGLLVSLVYAATYGYLLTKFDTLVLIGMFLGGALVSMVVMYLGFFVRYGKKNKTYGKKKRTDYLDLAILFGSLLISGFLFYLYCSTLKSNFDFTKLDRLGTFIAAIGALITARWIYRQFQDNKRQFSLTSVQNAFFSLYEINIKAKAEAKAAGKDKENDELPLTPQDLALFDLIVRNLDNGTMDDESVAYYLDLIFEFIKYDTLFKKYKNKEKYKNTLERIKTFRETGIWPSK